MIKIERGRSYRRYRRLSQSLKMGSNKSTSRGCAGRTRWPRRSLRPSAGRFGCLLSKTLKHDVLQFLPHPKINKGLLLDFSTAVVNVNDPLISRISGRKMLQTLVNCLWPFQWPTIGICGIFIMELCTNRYLKKINKKYFFKIMDEYKVIYV